MQRSYRKEFVYTALNLAVPVIVSFILAFYLNSYILSQYS